MKEASMIYKLIILFFLDKVDDPLPEHIITNFVLDKGYTTYFYLNQAFVELLDSDLITEKHVYQSTHYSLTEDGKQTLNFFYNELSKEIREEITDYLKENKYNIKTQTSLIADYNRIKQNEYMASCSVVEKGSTLLEIRLNVPTEKEAKIVCENWRNKSLEAYEKLIGILLE